MEPEVEIDEIAPSHASRLHLLLTRGGISPAERGACVSKLDAQIRKAVEQLHISNFNVSRPNGGVFAGTTGVGKTYAMAAFARYRIEKRFAGIRPEHINMTEVPLLWCSVPDLIAQWKSLGLRLADQERFLQPFFHVEHLCLDDLGAEIRERGGRDYDKGLAFVERVIRHRYDHYRATSCTTNCSAEALILRYGAPVYSRLQHMSQWIEFPKGSRDRRLQAKRPTI